LCGESWCRVSSSRLEPFVYYLDSILSYGDDEIDESSGTWGYSIYEVGDVKQARIKLKKAVKVLLEEVVNEIDM
jgi:hypothetical protein